ncbi:hypothetical protein L6R50_01840 [Myxococcota bacterium]|nr:hypothetical protein [Myxococcota bacterium]
MRRLQRTRWLMGAAGAAALLAAIAWAAVHRLGSDPPPPSAPRGAADRAPPHRDPGDDLRARELLGDGLYLESGMGDYRGAVERYRQAAALSDVDPGTRGEVLFRLGHALERLGERAEAGAAFQGVLDLPTGRSRWSEPARVRLTRIRESEGAVRDLPAALDFERDGGGWQHSSHYAAKGTVQRVEDAAIARTGSGVLEWRTTVVAREDDLIYLPLDTEPQAPRRVSFAVRTTAFTARLFLFAVLADGSRYSSPGFVVSPADGWIHRDLHLASDFRPIAGQVSGTPLDPSRIKFLMLQDATGYFSTDRGENRILLDDFLVR